MANAFIDKLSRSDRRLLVRLLRDTFPDSERSDENLTTLAAALWQVRDKDTLVELKERGLDLRGYSSELEAYARPLVNPPRTGFRSTGPGTGVRYYLAEAEHARKPPLRGLPDPFVGRLGMVRVSLPERRPRTIHTAIGTVDPKDHLIASVAQARAKVPRGVDVERVDLITPPRQSARIGAISVLLIYSDAGAGLPSCYMLEAGTAMGETKVVYWGPAFDELITRFCGYQPTPFSDKDNRYVGSLTLAGDSPKHLRVQASRNLHRSGDLGDATNFGPHYMEVNVKFTEHRTGSLDLIWPGLLTAEAASLVLLRKPTIDRRNNT